MNVPICDRGERWLDIGAASPAWIGRKGFAFRSLFEAGLDERGQVRDSLSLSAWSGSPPLSLKGKAREGGPLETFAFGSILITWPRKDLSLPVYCYIKAFQPSRDVRLDAVDKWIGSR